MSVALLPLAAADPTVFAAFAAGLLSFASPCVLPLVPGYLSVLTGGESVRSAGDRRTGAILGPAAIFCMSFILVFVVLGLFAQGLGAPLKGSRDTLDVVAGILLITMGVVFVASPFVPLLNRSFRSDALMRKAGTGGPMIAGMAFAVAWTPCAGPILGAILTAAATQTGTGGGAFLLLAYGLGLAVPFMGAALALERVTNAARVIRNHYTVITVVGGVLLIVIGWLVATHQMTRLASEARDVIDALGLDGVVAWLER
ncbi:cytochrome c biogenesis CcdA family protein [Patulibacter sp.]|uniref:cytochrome c biogenesis CcdA family protein n=1 Tax=Patulibacter sp. TaxID=1912859 RepID=UPI002723F900|nr:cytochrome c biogenesis CcdA family protein [Patulibacter sp.]MDO9409511.1 cytochrome c biogenesis CcdA family protein [Patulibacter sp.]